ncbi:MAG TPA: lasso RiPP family leader peptide-containing protein [Candidatus Limnocylindrales bacterium]|nr:lasso RiPP family leader peptide-containing protein [Candidatus Limnocylindrales bacterium]
MALFTTSVIIAAWYRESIGTDLASPSGTGDDEWEVLHMEPISSPVEEPVEREAVYQPPMLVEIGLFAEVTRGASNGPWDFFSVIRGYWLI